MTRPRIICHMTSSIDGGLHPSRYTDATGGKAAWSAAYEQIHDRLGADAWIVGRVTMAEMAKGEPHPPAKADAVNRRRHVAPGAKPPYAVAPDRAGRLHFGKPDIGGDHVVVLLGNDVPDAHLAELAADGVSYLVADGPEIDMAAALAVLRSDFGVETLLLEGGAGINGSFLAAGWVDELSIVLAPAIDGGVDAERIVAAGDGLKGRVTLDLLGCERLEGGVLQLRYAVAPAS